MEAREYDALAAVEFDHWWFRGLHPVLIGWIRDRAVGPDVRVLDAGCGTGGFAAKLNAAFPAGATAFDLSCRAATYWPERRLTTACVASIEHIPFAAAQFDAVVSVDVLESEGIEPRRAIRELARVLRPDGWLLIVVPAYRWMLDDAHHHAVRAVRRFARREATDLIRNEGLEVLRSTHFFALPFPAIALRRLLVKIWRRPQSTSDLAMPPAWLNRLLIGMMRLEARLLRWTDMPFGTSILLLARKTGTPLAHG